MTAGLNENHQRRLLATFHYVDELLAEAAAHLEPARGERLFPRYLADASAAQRQVIADHLARLRHVMRRFLEENRFPREASVQSGLHALRVAVEFVRTALEEIAPAYLAGYGPLPPEAAAAQDRLLAQLQGIVDQLAAYLDRGEGGDLRERLARLDQTQDEVGLLQELARVVAAHGLVEFRSTLAWLTERFERNCLELAFFGRVSSGKSSLLNALLERDVLPVGVTPVTAVPARIVPGSAERARISFAAGKEQDVPLARLAEFASEEGNPNNIRQVTGILVELAAPALTEGVCFVDTPGLGSLATAGAALTREYLPRCDVAVLLVDAGGSLAPEDIAVARALLESGAELRVAVSKADLLAEADLRKLSDYLRAKLEAEAGAVCAVSAVSTRPRAAAIRWFEAELLPLLARRRLLALQSLRRKTGALREAVVAALRLRASGAQHDPAAAARHRQAEEALAEGKAVLKRAHRRILDIAENLSLAADAILAAAARELAQYWAGASDVAASVEQAVAAAMAREADRHAAAFDALLAETRETVAQKLAAASVAMPETRGDPELPPRAAGRPLLDLSDFLDADLSDTPLAFLGGARMRGALARRRVTRAFGERLPQKLRLHAEILKHWAFGELEALEQAFEAAGAGYLALGRLSAATPEKDTDRAVGGLAQDIERLVRWNEMPHPQPGH
jgi:GTP-binding protein EngB required for normal cell division